MNIWWCTTLSEFITLENRCLTLYMEKPLKCIFTDLENKAVSTARKELFYHLHTFIKDNNDNDVDLSRFIKYIKHWSAEKKN